MVQADPSFSGGPAMASPWTRMLRLVAKPGVQRWAARFPLTRRVARRDGAALFDLLSGFCHSQVLMALVAFDLPRRLMDGPLDAARLGRLCDLAPERMEILLRAGASIGLLRRKRCGRFMLTRRGAALAGVPGLDAMILHNRVLYRDLMDPEAFFRGEGATELAGFWPYVLGADAACDPEIAATYSTLMAQSQALVAEETLAAVSLSDTRSLLDIGGGTGAFLAEAGRRYPDMALSLFDLPAVADMAGTRFADSATGPSVTIHAGSFRDDPLPTGCDTISLVRVLFDHSDATALTLLKAVRAALPAGGRLLISEPMGRKDRPERAADAYYALYTLAMGTGRTRTVEEIEHLCQSAGFTEIINPPTSRPFITRVVTARRPA